MKRWFLCILALPASLSAQAPSGEPAPAGPEPPAVEYAQAARMTQLAREAMDLYLRRRTGPEDQPIPATLHPLAKTRLPVAVTLRSRGRVVARAVAHQLSTPGNVIAAALEAMRSPDLPDRVTAEVLAGLTVELEIFSRGQYAQPGQLDRLIRPGLTGLSLAQGTRQAWLSPAEAYVQGWQADQMRRRLLWRIPLRARSAELKRFWKVFATLHVLDRPGHRPLLLFRGKLPIGPETVDKKLAAANAEGIARALQRLQQPDGRIGQGDRTGLADHALATSALARYAGSRNDPPLHRAVDAAMAWTARMLSQAPPPANADQVAETIAWALLTRPGKENGAGRQARKQLAQALLNYIAQPQNERAGRPTIRTAAAVALALGRIEPDPAARSAVQTYTRQLARRVASDAAEFGWLVRAGIDRPVLSAEIAPPDGPSRPIPLDARGGFALADHIPTTEATALALLNIAANRRWAEMPAVPAWPGDQGRRMQLAQTRFLIQMVVRAPEAFYAAQPEQHAGRVRIGPAAAETSVPAAALALEALTVALGG